MISTEIMNITPDMAREMLTHNTKNRKVRNDAVTAFARDMANGEWTISHQGIAFDSEGTLIDGQHRLMAIVKANVPVTMMVTRGFEPKTIGIIDNNIKRTTKDFMEWNTDDAALRNGKVIAAAKFILREVMHVGHQITDNEIKDFMQDNIELMRLMDGYARHYKKASQAYMLALCASCAISNIPHRHVLAWMDIQNSNILPGPGTEYNVKAALDWKDHVVLQAVNSRLCLARAQAAFWLFYENRKKLPSDTKDSIRYPITKAGLEGYKKQYAQMAFDAARDAAQKEMAGC